jgi:glycerol-3-phosphate dehydrogenase
VKLTTAFELASRVVPLLQQYHSNNYANDHSDEPVGSSEFATTSVAETPAVLSLDTPSAVKRALESMENDDVRELVRHCVHHEYALTLEDLLQRRLGLLPFDYPGEQLRRSLAEHMARLLDWDDARTTQELRQADSVQTEDPLNSFALAATSAKGVGL